MVSLRLLSSRLFRRISYELFLRCHQGLAVVMAYALWRYVPSSSKVPRAYLLASGGTFLITLVMQCFAVLYRNFSLHRGCSRALIARQNGAVRMTISPPARGKSRPDNTSTFGFRPLVCGPRYRAILSPLRPGARAKNLA